MYTLLFAIHLIVSLLLCVVVLIQQSKGGGLAGAFGGGGGGEAMFGARGVTTFLHKATIYLGAAFMLSSVLLVVFSSRGDRVGSGGSLTGEAAERLAPAAQQSAPVATPIDDFAPAEPGSATGTDDDGATDNQEAGGQ